MGDLIRFPIERVRYIRGLVMDDPGTRPAPVEYVWAPGWFAVRLRPAPPVPSPPDAA